MLDPSILVGSGPPQGASSHLDGVSPVLPDARVAMELAKQAESRSQMLAAAIEMMSAIDAAKDLEQAADHAARMLSEITAAARVIVLWRDRSRRGLTVIADNGDRGDGVASSEQRMVIAAGEEVAARDAITRWPPETPTVGHALMAASQLANALSAESLVGVGLPDASGQDRGVVLAIGATDPLAGDFLNAIAGPLASKLSGIQRLQPTSFESTLRSVVEVARGSRRNVILSIAIAIAMLMLLPMPYQIRAELELQPVKHRFIAVPFDGPLESAHVRPGDVVEQGDLLATINPREIEYELASIRAELNRSVQEKKGKMAEHDIAGSKIASLESDRLRLQSDLLQYRHDNLEIRSPIAGVVVSGDLKQSEGMPMSRGETLFEIAPLGQMVVEIAVPEDDFGHVRQGMPAEFYVHAIPSRTMHGTVDRLHPRAELREHDNVFIAEVQIADPENILRPGMRGRAKIRGDRHTLAWNLFHKAYYALRRATGW